MIFRRKITEKRVSYLTDTIAEIVAKYKKREDVECIYFHSYRDHVIELIDEHIIAFSKPEGLTGNSLLITIVFSGEITDEIEKELNEEKEKYRNSRFRRNAGFDIFFYPDSRKNYKLVNIENVDINDKYFFSKLNGGIEIRDLNLSTIVYDKTDDGYYNKVAHQLDDYVNFKEIDKTDSITLDINIDSISSKQKTLIKH
jgi:hypothetical protein